MALMVSPFLVFFTLPLESVLTRSHLRAVAATCSAAARKAAAFRSSFCLDSALAMFVLRLGCVCHALRLHDVWVGLLMRMAVASDTLTRLEPPAHTSFDTLILHPFFDGGESG